MAIRETLELDISRALNQLNDLERELDGLFQPIVIPVDIQSEQALARLRQDIARTDAQDIDINVDVDGIQRAENQMEGLRREVDQTGDEFTELRRRADSSNDAILRVGSRGTSVFTNLRGSILGVAAGFAAFAGVGAFGRFAFDAIQSASALEESLSKTNVVFGEFSDDIEAFSSTAPEALGLSNAAALETTATFGNLFTALGLSQQAAAELSPDIVQLGADLASFNNTTVDEALVALRAGLVGEVEPLRRLGVAINAAAVETKALELGLVDANGVVTEAGKVQARYALILEQTTNAQGDFARTADGVANRQRTLQAAFQNLQSEIGQALLPAFEALIDTGPSLIALIEGLVPAIESGAVAFGDFVESVQPVLDNLTLIQQGFGAFFDLLGAGSGAARQGLEILTSIFTLQLGDTIDNVREAGDAFQSLFDRLQDRGTIAGVANDIRAGGDAAEVFVAGLRQVADQNDITAGTFDRLAATAGLTNDEIIGAIRDIRDNADAYNLDAQAVAFLNTELERLLLIQQGFSRRTPGGNQQTPDTTSFTDLVLPDFIGELTNLPGIVDQANAALADLDFEPFIEQSENAAQAFIDLADTGGAASAALETEGDEVLESLRGFLDDFEEELRTRNQFQDNLTLLRAMGFGNLADVFAEEGLAASKALTEAIHNPEQAAEGERLAEENARTQARKFDEVFRQELSDLILSQPVEVTLASIQIPDIQAALNIGPIGGGVGVGDIIVNINNPTTNDLETDANRGAQEIGAVVGNRTGGTISGRG